MSIGRLVYHHSKPVHSKLLQNVANRSVCSCRVEAISTESTAQFPWECDLPNQLLVDSFTINQNYYEINRTNQSAGSGTVQGLSTESTAQFRWGSNLPSCFRQLVDSFTINQNYYKMPRTTQLVAVEDNLHQLRALPNFCRNGTCESISTNWKTRLSSIKTTEFHGPVS